MNWFENIFILQFLIGIVFLLLGLIQFKYPLKKINDLYGYRTKNAMSSSEKWNFAQKHAAKLSIKIAVFQIICSFTGSLFTQSENLQLIIGILATLSSCGILFYFTEKKLRINFSNQQLSNI